MTTKFDAMASAKVFAGTPEQTAKNLELIKFPALCSIKYDGWRMFEYNGEVRCRSMKPPKNKNVQRQMAELFRAAADIGMKGLDGEALVGDEWDMNCMQNSSSMFNSYDVVGDFTFHVFDSYQFRDEPFANRLLSVNDAVQRLQPEFPWLRFVQHTKITDHEDLAAELDDVVSRGGEGIMGRSLDGKYKMGRSTMKEGWLWALKPYMDDEAKIVGFEEELENQNEQTVNERGYSSRSGHKENLVPKGRLGKFICESSKFPGVTFGVGAGIGLTHALRQEVWDNRDSYLGRYLTYKYQAVGVKDRPRQPKFMGFRAAEDMSA